MRVPPDDGVAPNTPTGLALTPQLRSLYVSWNAPIASDYAEVTQIDYRRTDAGGGTPGPISTVTASTDNLGTLVSGLAVASYDVKIKTIDHWGHVSSATWWVSATPLANTADQVTGATQIAEGVIKALNLATAGSGMVANILPVGMSSYDAYGSSTRALSFTPLLFSGMGANWALATGVGTTKFLRLLTSISSAQVASITPFDYFALPSDQKYIFSCHVRNYGASPVDVSCRLAGADDINGLNAVTLGESPNKTIPMVRAKSSAGFREGSRAQPLIGLVYDREQL